MKRSKFLMPLLSFGLLSSLSLSAHSMTVLPLTLQQIVKNGGENSVWIDGEIKSVEVAKNENNWTYSTVTIEGTVLKAPPAGYQHAKLGAWVKADSKPQKIQVLMFGRPNRAVISGIDPVPAVGTKGIMCWTGEHKTTGFSSPCGSERQGIFKEKVVYGKTYVSNQMGKQILALDQVSLRQPSEAQQKSLRAIQSASENLPKEDFENVLKALIAQEFPASK